MNQVILLATCAQQWKHMHIATMSVYVCLTQRNAALWVCMLVGSGKPNSCINRASVCIHCQEAWVI